MRFDCLFFCLCLGGALWAVGVVSTCRDRGTVPRVTLALLAAKALFAGLKQFRQLPRT